MVRLSAGIPRSFTDYGEHPVYGQCLALYLAVLHRVDASLTFLALLLAVAIDLQMPLAPTPVALLFVLLALRTLLLSADLSVPLPSFLPLSPLLLPFLPLSSLPLPGHPIQPMSIGVAPDGSPDAAARPWRASNTPATSSFILSCVVSLAALRQRWSRTSSGQMCFSNTAIYVRGPTRTGDFNP